MESMEALRYSTGLLHECTHIDIFLLSANKKEFLLWEILKTERINVSFKKLVPLQEKSGNFCLYFKKKKGKNIAYFIETIII